MLLGRDITEDVSDPALIPSLGALQFVASLARARVFPAQTLNTHLQNKLALRPSLHASVQMPAYW